ncbi:MAG: four helix bundle protein [Proteobacteria bacterium]|nr:four helix bundle protein [Pseudomonadota bacterium]
MAKSKNGGSVVKFRFQNLEIWKESIDIGNILFDIADTLEQKKLYRFAEQLRGSGISMSNNIAEGSGSNSKTEFRNFLNIARRSTFEVVNILVILNMRNLIDQETIDFLFNRLETLSRKTTQFQRSLQ